MREKRAQQLQSSKLRKALPPGPFIMSELGPLSSPTTEIIGRHIGRLVEGTWAWSVEKNGNVYCKVNLVIIDF
jgi:hypothetical protein